jgi:hypothetical protein
VCEERNLSFGTTFQKRIVLIHGRDLDDSPTMDLLQQEAVVFHVRENNLSSNADELSFDRDRGHSNPFWNPELAPKLVTGAWLVSEVVLGVPYWTK